MTLGLEAGPVTKNWSTRAVLAVQWLARRRLVRQLLTWFAGTSLGLMTALALATGVDPIARRYVLRGAAKFIKRSHSLTPLVNLARRRLARRPSVARIEALIVVLIEAERYPEVLALATGAEFEKFADSYLVLSGQLRALLELGDYAGATDAAFAFANAHPDDARAEYELLSGAYAAGMSCREAAALSAFSAQYGADVPPAPPPDLDDIARRAAWDRIAERVFAAIPGQALVHAARFQGNADARPIGVFFLSSTKALGHSILDPYHFLALNRNRYERIVFIGPPRALYSRASAVCLSIVERYGQYVETGDELLQNLSWMHLGKHRIGPLELVVEHYWSLLREVTRRSLDRSDPFRHNAWHMSLPANLERAGRAFAKRHGFGDAQRIVTLHVRDSGYHSYLKQSYRDAEIADYRAAVDELLSRGYGVVRLGDDRQERLGIDHPRYLELPFADGYAPELDPYFVARSDFMIGCQSGPCAYARAFGRPLLTVNAVFHYSLLPAVQELACFKRYLVEDDGDLRELSLAEVLDRRLFYLENSFQFDRQGIRLDAVPADAIVEAVREMVAWVADAGMPQTDGQAWFAKIVEAAGREAQRRPQIPIADYLGIVLPGYRIASVACANAGLAPGSGGLATAPNDADKLAH